MVNRRYADLRRLLSLAAVALVVFMTGCDTLAETETPEFQEDVSFRFDFTAATGSVGEEVESTTTQTVDLDDVLDAYGYAKGDVISVTVLSVELNLVQPAQLDLSSFTQASLALTAAARGDQTIAASSSLQGDRASLFVTGADVTGITTAPEFSATLTVVPAVEEQYVVTADIDLRIEVEGV